MVTGWNWGEHNAGPSELARGYYGISPTLSEDLYCGSTPILSGVLSYLFCFDWDPLGDQKVLSCLCVCIVCGRTLVTSEDL